MIIGKLNGSFMVLYETEPNQYHFSWIPADLARQKDLYVRIYNIISPVTRRLYNVFLWFGYGQEQRRVGGM